MKHCLIVASSLLLAAHASAQDPTFRAPAPRAADPAPSAPSGPVTMSAGTINNMEVLDNSNTIRPGDELSLRVVEDRTPPMPYRVGVSGEINAPHVGVVRAAGRTCRELAFSIKSMLEKSVFKKATVIITIDRREPDYRGGRGGGYGIGVAEQEIFTVFGQVIRQGQYELSENSDVTISQAILQTGGFAQFANPKKVKLVRKYRDGNKTILVNVDQIMRKGDLSKDIFIRDGDVIIVDEKTVNF